MQYAIVLIDKLGFQPTKTYNSTKNKVIMCLDDFDKAQTYLKSEYEAEIDMDEFYSLTVQDKADEVLQYFANIEPKRMGDHEEIYRTTKEVALNYYATVKEFGTICFMYHSYCKRAEAIAKSKNRNLVA